MPLAFAKGTRNWNLSNFSFRLSCLRVWASWTARVATGDRPDHTASEVLRMGGSTPASDRLVPLSPIELLLPRCLQLAETRPGVCSRTALDASGCMESRFQLSFASMMTTLYMYYRGGLFTKAPTSQSCSWPRGASKAQPVAALSSHPMCKQPLGSCESCLAMQHPAYKHRPRSRRAGLPTTVPHFLHLHAHDYSVHVS